MQLTPLREYAARMGWKATEYLEKQSSMKKRPVYERLLADARAGKIDTILVWKIDRFARSMRQFVNVTYELGQIGVSVRSLTQNISSDASDPMGVFLLGLFGLLAELERNIIVERVKAGLDEARRQGKKLGPPKRIFARGKAAKLREQGKSWRSIAATLNVPMSTVREALGALGDRRKRGVRQSV